MVKRTNKFQDEVSFARYTYVGKPCIGGTQVDGGEVFWVQYKTILFFGIGFWQYVTRPITFS
jgi:hypothetical protein